MKNKDVVKKAIIASIGFYIGQVVLSIVIVGLFVAGLLYVGNA